MRKSCWQPASSSLYAPHYKTVTPPYNHNWILITVSGNIQAHGVKLQHSNLLNRFLHPTLCRGTSIFQSATLGLAQHLPGGTGREPDTGPGRRPGKRCGTCSLLGGHSVPASSGKANRIRNGNEGSEHWKRQQRLKPIL